ncbi:Phosphorylase family protein [Tritrichomonas foetus]|uniref:Phosphorylase family protein n=1 Tax=Tritrichomonas foetus TaxID=1144522 RepID=A0A1J4KMW2_9EUKA|nr:Phosphorylase family protein [Tritrichomonas foetus]|eukprot:OHT11140.1 Phosphorylase family protein [Tritrichomonas foetus]
MSGFTWFSPSKSVFDSDGRIQPLGVRKGELANRILTVGDPNRALKISKTLDEGSVKIYQSNMIFCVYTGTYKGTPVSIIATGMGFAMAELMVVQARAVTEGPLYIVRFGTCGSLSADVPVGCYAITDRAYFIRQDYENAEFPFEIAKEPIPLDKELLELIKTEFGKLKEYRSVVGPDTSADTFYSSQGRLDDNFVMNNNHVIPKILDTIKDALSFEMETYLLAFLSNKFPDAQLRTGAVCLTLAQRTSGDFLPNDKKAQMEMTAASALLSVLIQAK